MTGILNKETLLPLSMVIAIVGGAVWINNNLVRRDAKLDQFMMQVNFRLESIEEKVDNGITDRWRGKDMEHWAALLQSKNPALDVPEPDTANGNR